MNEITYTNKVALNENASIPDINKVTDSDMNEIKSVVNTNSQISSNNFGLGTNTWTSSATYSIGDIAVYNSNTYKNLTGTNTATTPDQDSTNWEVMPLIVDVYNTSAKNTYCCDYINNAIENAVQDVYSTSEVKTNKVWIDGKPIYRKVITFTLSSTTGKFQYQAHNISNIGTYRKIELYYVYDNGYYKTPNDVIIEVGVNDTNIAYYNNNQYITGQSAYAILEYTKATD